MPVAPPVVLVTPTVVPAFPPVAPLHPVAPTLTTNMDTTVSFTKRKHARFDMVPPVTRETGTLDALSPTWGSLPGNTRQENTTLGGWREERRHHGRSKPRVDLCFIDSASLGGLPYEPLDRPCLVCVRGGACVTRDRGGKARE